MKRIAHVAASIAAIFFAGTALAQHVGRGNANGHDDDRGPNDNSSQVAVDSAGKLRPVTPEEARELLAGIARYVDQSDVGLKWTLLPSGAVAIDLDDRFQSATLARVGIDGSVHMQCVGSQAEGAHFLATNAALATARRRAATPIALEEK